MFYCSCDPSIRENPGIVTADCYSLDIILLGQPTAPKDSTCKRKVKKLRFQTEEKNVEPGSVDGNVTISGSDVDSSFSSSSALGCHASADTVSSTGNESSFDCNTKSARNCRSTDYN